MARVWQIIARLEGKPDRVVVSRIDTKIEAIFLYCLVEKMPLRDPSETFHIDPPLG